MIRIPFPLLVPLIAVTFLATLSMAESPEDIYLNADILISKAKEQESRRFYKSAHESIQKAQSELASLQQSNPEWHPDWIERKMTGVREATERLAPLLAEFPNSVESAPSNNPKGYSVPPSAAKKTSAIDEALKPSVNISSGIAAPIEVHKGSSHERYLKNDPNYLAHLEEVKADAARRRMDAEARQRALREEARLNQQELNKLTKRHQEEQESLQKLERASLINNAQAVEAARKQASKQNQLALEAKQEQLQQQTQDQQARIQETRDRLKQEQLRINQNRAQAQQKKIEEARRRLEQNQVRIRQKQSRIQAEQAESIRLQQEANAKAESARQQAEEAARKKRVLPRTRSEESSGRSRFRIG